MQTAAFYALTIGFAGGIFLRSLFDFSLGATLLIAALCAMCAGALRIHMGMWTVLSVVFVCVAIAGACGVWRTDASLQRDAAAPLAAHVGDEVVIEGIIDRAVDERARTTQLTVRADLLNDEPVDARLLIITERFPQFRFGDRVRAAGTLSLPEAFETDLGRTFNYPGYLAARGITYTLPFARVEHISSGDGNPIIASLLALRRTFMASVEQQLPEPYAGLGEGLTLGVRRALGDELEEVFRIAGIIHIVVLSGYNVTIVAEAIMRLCAAFLGVRTRTIAGVAAIAAFAIVAGLSATVLRASLMACLVLAARATGRTYDVLRALALAGVVMLIVNPKLLVFDPGFQLSFLATVGLVVLAPLIEVRLSLVPTRFQIREFLTATIATQLFILPLLLYSIGQLSIVSVVVNVLVLPAVPLAMLLVFLSGCIGLFSGVLSVPVSFAAYVLLAYMIAIAEWFAALPFAAVQVPVFPFFVVVLAYALLIYIIVRASRGILTVGYKQGASDG